MQYSLLTALVGLVLALQPVAGPLQDPTRPAPARRVALVVGSAGYPDVPLAEARNAARAVAAELDRQGVQVTLLEDATAVELIRSARAVGNRLGPADVAIFYFAGYGVQIDGANLLMPVDARGRTATDVRREGVSAVEIQRLLQPARVSILVLDACRDSPFTGTRAGLAPMSAPGSLVMFAAAANAIVVPPAGASRGFFPDALLAVLREPGLGVREAFQRVARQVAAATEGRQTPAIYDGLASEAPLTPAVTMPSSPAPAETVKPPPAPPPANAPPTGSPVRPPTPGAPPKSPPASTPKPAPTVPGTVRGVPPARRSPLPDFPWPPPAASEQVTLDRSLFPPGRSMSTVGDQLVRALDDARYEYSYYRAPGGFAVVARLERVDATGKPVPGDARFAAPDAREQFSLASYVKQLFFAAEGYYRLIVFVATDQPFTATGPSLRSKEAGELLARGSNRLPAEYDKLLFSEAHRVSALVYEFRKGSRDGDATHLVPGRLGALVHLERAGIYQTLLRSR